MRTNQHSFLNKSGSFFKIILFSAICFTLASNNGIIFGAQLKITFNPSPDPRVVGHKVYFAKVVPHLTIYMVDLKDADTYITPNLPKNASYYFAATAYDQYGSESNFSNIYIYHPPEDSQYPIENPIDIFYAESFNNYLAGDNAMYWYDTGPANSMIEVLNLFEIFTINGNNAIGTRSGIDNIHSHYIGPCNYDLASFEFSGRMMRTDDHGGVGVTFLSNYPISHKYYRLSSFGHEPFHLEHHSSEISTLYGTIFTGVVPVPYEWYRFRIQVQETGTQTEILAKVWAEYDSEPDQWQIDAFDDTPNRQISGTFGLWSHHSGSKYWDDLMIQYP